MNISLGEIIILMFILSFGGFFMYIVIDLIRYGDKALERMEKNKAKRDAAKTAEGQA